MSTTSRVLAMAASLVLGGLPLLPGSVQAATGGFTFEFQNGIMPPPKPSGPNVVRIFAKAELSGVETSFKKTYLFSQGGATEQQVRDKVLADLQASGWGATAVGANRILVTGRQTSLGFLPIKETGGDDNHEGINIAYAGTVDLDEVSAGTPAQWRFITLRLSADGVNPGTLAVTFHTTAGTIDVTAPLAPFDDGEQAAIKLRGALTSAGFQVTRITNQVLLDWENPVNLALLGNTVEVVMDLRDGGPPSLILVLPATGGTGPPPPGPPAAPSNLVATTVSPTQINLSWTDESDNETVFKIERRIGARGNFVEVATVGANVHTYSDTGLTGTITHYYRVRASNAAGNSAYSNTASALP